MSTVRAYVALGANIGAPVQHLRAAVVDLAALPGTRVVARSSLYRSAPVGLVDQPDFINAVVATLVEPVAGSDEDSVGAASFGVACSGVSPARHSDGSVTKRRTPLPAAAQK